MIQLNHQHIIVDAKAIFDNNAIRLNEIPQGDTGKVRCYFFYKQYKDFKITLRLDWGSLDPFGNPTLDVDIKKSGIDYHKSRKQWHNTQKKIENGLYIYVWKPKIEELKKYSIEIKFKLETMNQQIITGKSAILRNDNKTKPLERMLERQNKLLKKLFSMTGVDKKRDVAW